MLVAGFTPQTALDEMERVLASPGFVRNERLSKFLRVVVERNLAGKDDELKESVLGVEVFGRSPGYDPKRDPVVRTEAARLRARLGEYYSGPGKESLVIIELPKGGYVPEFREIKATEPESVSTPAEPLSKTPPARSWTLIALAFAGVVLCIAGWRWIAIQAAPIPIAVLPLRNLSEDQTNDFFADGLTGEIIRNLSIIEGLAVRSQTSSFAFKGSRPKAREAGNQLGADYILEGSVLRSGGELRINVQLVRVRGDLAVWSERYDRKSADVFAIQDEISRGIVNSLRLKLGRGRRRYETSVEAYDFYLRARASIIQWGVSGEGASIEPYERAIAKDAAFAPAYAGLAAAYVSRSSRFRFDQIEESIKMRAAAQTAVKLDPLLPEAHEALGMVYARDGQWKLSERSFHRAIELAPGRSASFIAFAMYHLWPLGRTAEALNQLRLAEKTDPHAADVHSYLSMVLIALGRYEEAGVYCEKFVAAYPGRTSCLVHVRLGLGKFDEAIQIVEPEFRLGLPADSPKRGELGCAYARSGRRGEAEQIAAGSGLNPFNQAFVFACLGDKERTFEALERAAVVGPIPIGRKLNSPEFALLRGESRLAVLRKKVGLPEQ